MSFNMNYSFLLEGQDLKYNINKYTPVDNSDFLNESSLYNLISNFNNEIRFTRTLLNEAYEESFNESFSISNIVDTIKTSLQKLINAIINIKNAIISKLKKLLDAIRLKLASRKDKIDEKYKLHERITLLNKAIKDEESEPTINIRSIDANTGELLNPDFPDLSIIKDDLVTFIISTISSCVDNVDKKNGSSIEDSVSSEAKIAEDLRTLIANKKDEMLYKIFGKYSFDPTNLTASRIEISNKIFNKDAEFEDIKLTSELYIQACNNIEELVSIEKEVSKKIDEVQSVFSKLTTEVQNTQNKINRLEALAKRAEGYSVDMKERYHTAMKNILPVLSASLNTINEIISVSYGFLMDKSIRLNDIINDSYKVKKLAHRLINRQLGTAEEDVISGKESTNEIYKINDEFNITLDLIEESFREQNFNNFVEQVILEADGDNNAAAQNTQDAAPANAQQTNTQQQTTTTTTETGGLSDKIKTVIDKIIANLGAAMNRLRERIVVLFNKKYWDTNKDGISKLNLTDTKVNEWYNYNIPIFKNSVYVKFEDPNSDIFKNDENMQNEILKKVAGSSTLPNTINKDDSFAQKLTKIYQGEYINEANSEGKTLAEVKFNSGEAFQYVDGLITKGFNSEALGSISKDYEDLSNDHKNLSKNYQSYLDRFKAEKAENVETVTQTTEVKTEPQNASAIEYDDFKFNLAEHFGLMDNHLLNINEAPTYTIGAGDRAQAAANGGVSANNKKNAELDARISRCYRYNAIAISTKMTNSIAAYKQIMDLYKHIYNKK